MRDKPGMIEVFPWNRNFETGIPLVDEQHRKLVDLLNRLAIKLAYDSGEMELTQVIEEMAAYAGYHFQTEESIWKRGFHDDTWLASHQSSHDAFTIRVAELTAEGKSKSIGEVLFDEILRFLIHWLAHHILDSDMRMAKALHAIDEGLDLAQAKQRAEVEMGGSIQLFIETLLGMYGDLSARTLELMREKLERSRIEQALKLSEQHERAFSDTVIASIPGLLYLYDGQFRLVRWNRRHSDELGYSDEELKGKYVLDFFEEAKHGRIRAILAALNAGNSVEIEEEVRRKDGSVVPYLLTGVPLEIDDKHCFLGSAIDISRLKLIEKELRESRDMHLEAQRLSHMGHWQLNVVSSELLLSEEVHRIFGIEAQTSVLPCKTVLDKIHSKDRVLLEHIYNDALKNHTPFDETIRLPLENGRSKYVRVRGIVSDTEDGRPLKSVGTVHDITKDIEAERELERRSQEAKAALIGIVIAVSKAMEARDPYTAGHQQRVAKIAVAIAEKLGLDEHRIEGLHLGATVHDIGKMAIPVELLVKPTRLSPLEYSIIQTHAQAGADILKEVNFPWPILEIVSWHHERLDGSGYPCGLQGKELCLEVRIVAVADVFEAMSAHRPYRPALGMKPAMEELKRNRGKIYDAEVVDALLHLLDEEAERFAVAN
ncbi:MAG: bacteriohemerythrin [Gammaproteobacteria bacterium]